MPTATAAFFTGQSIAAVIVLPEIITVNSAIRPPDPGVGHAY
jgi:hypothetical protein